MFQIAVAFPLIGLLAHWHRAVQRHPCAAANGWIEFFQLFLEFFCTAWIMGQTNPKAMLICHPSHWIVYARMFEVNCSVHTAAKMRRLWNHKHGPRGQRTHFIRHRGRTSRVMRTPNDNQDVVHPVLGFRAIGFISRRGGDGAVLLGRLTWLRMLLRLGVWG